MLAIFSSCFGFNGKFNKPLAGDVWTVGQSITIEWLAGNTPVTLPAGYPLNLNIYYLNAVDNSMYSQVTVVDPSQWARWIYDLPSMPSGSYKVQLCDSANPTDCIVSPAVTINGVNPTPIPIPSPKQTDTTTIAGGNYTFNSKNYQNDGSSCISMSYILLTLLQ